MKPVTLELREKLGRSRFGRWCGLFILALLTWLNRDAPGWHGRFYAAVVAVGLGLEIFWWFRLRHPSTDAAAQGIRD